MEITIQRYRFQVPTTRKLVTHSSEISFVSWKATDKMVDKNSARLTKIAPMTQFHLHISTHLMCCV